MRTLAIGDIHGHTRALRALLAALELRPDDRLIFMGDYVDKGPDVKGTIDALLALREVQPTVFLRGNHDQLLIDAHRDPSKRATWECLAGDEPLASYGPDDDDDSVDPLTRVPTAHWVFLETMCRNYLETPALIFVHGGLRPQVDPADEEPERLLWTTLSCAEAHHSGRTVICGHSSQRSGAIADLSYTICIDTAISHGGWLTALDVESFHYWQADAAGQTRLGKLR